MSACQICEVYDDRPSERIAHEILQEICQEEGYWRLVHAKPNSTRDREGKDFFIVPGRHFRSAVHIQIKKFRVLEASVLQRRLRRLKEPPRKKRHRTPQLDTAQKIRAYILNTLRDYKKLDALIADKKVQEEFNAVARKIKLDSLLRSKMSYEDFVGVYGEIEPFLTMFQMAIGHIKNYPNVKLFFIVNIEDDSKEYHDALKAEWKLLIKKYLAHTKPS